MSLELRNTKFILGNVSYSTVFFILCMGLPSRLAYGTHGKGYREGGNGYLKIPGH